MSSSGPALGPDLAQAQLQKRFIVNATGIQILAQPAITIVPGTANAIRGYSLGYSKESPPDKVMLPVTIPPTTNPAQPWKWLSHNTYLSSITLNNLPPILFQLLPGKDEHRNLTVPWLADLEGNLILGSTGRPLRFFSVLPRHLPNDFSAEKFELVMRLDSRMEVSDITDRMAENPNGKNGNKKPRSAALSNKRERFRDMINSPAWLSARLYPTSKDIKSLGNLTKEQILLNTSMVVRNGRLYQPQFTNERITGYIDSGLPLDYFVQEGPSAIPNHNQIMACQLRRRLQELALAQELGNTEDNWKLLKDVDRPSWFDSRNAKTKDARGNGDVASARDEKYLETVKAQKRKITEIDNLTHDEWAEMVNGMVPKDTIIPHNRPKANRPKTTSKLEKNREYRPKAGGRKRKAKESVNDSSDVEFPVQIADETTRKRRKVTHLTAIQPQVPNQTITTKSLGTKRKAEDRSEDAASDIDDQGQIDTANNSTRSKRPRLENAYLGSVSGHEHLSDPARPQPYPQSVSMEPWGIGNGLQQKCLRSNPRHVLPPQLSRNDNISSGNAHPQNERRFSQPHQQSVSNMLPEPQGIENGLHKSEYNQETTSLGTSGPRIGAYLSMHHAQRKSEQRLLQPYQQPVAKSIAGLQGNNFEAQQPEYSHEISKWDTPGQSSGTYLFIDHAHGQNEQRLSRPYRQYVANSNAVPSSIDKELQRPERYHQSTPRISQPGRLELPDPQIFAGMTPVWSSSTGHNTLPPCVANLSNSNQVTENFMNVSNSTSNLHTINSPALSGTGSRGIFIGGTASGNLDTEQQDLHIPYGVAHPDFNLSFNTEAREWEKDILDGLDIESMVNQDGFNFEDEV